MPATWYLCSYFRIFDQYFAKDQFFTQTSSLPSYVPKEKDSKQKNKTIFTKEEETKKKMDDKIIIRC